MLRIILKRCSDAMEKLAVGSVLVGLFQGEKSGICIGLVFMASAIILNYLESKL